MLELQKIINTLLTNKKKSLNQILMQNNTNLVKLINITCQLILSFFQLYFRTRNSNSTCLWNSVLVRLHRTARIGSFLSIFDFRLTTSDVKQNKSPSPTSSFFDLEFFFLFFLVVVVSMISSLNSSFLIDAFIDIQQRNLYCFRLQRKKERKYSGPKRKETKKETSI